MIKLTVLQLLNTLEPLQALAKQPHKGVVTFKLRRMVNVLQPELTAATAAKDALFTPENSDPLNNGRSLKPECIAAFLVDPLFNTSVEVDVTPLTPADLMDASISPAQIDALGPLVTCD